jgi:hypothetical protein
MASKRLGEAFAGGILFGLMVGLLGVIRHCFELGNNASFLLPCSIIATGYGLGVARRLWCANRRIAAVILEAGMIATGFLLGFSLELAWRHVDWAGSSKAIILGLFGGLVASVVIGAVGHDSSIIDSTCKKPGV